MKKLLNTLFVTVPEAYLACEGENVLVRVDGETKFRMPIHNLEGIVCFGFAGSSPALMYLCCERGVNLTFLNAYGKFMGRVSGKIHGNVLLRKKQFIWAESEEESLRLAQRFVLAKIHNSRTVLLRATRDHSDKLGDEVAQTGNELKHLMKKCYEAKDYQTLLGVEGSAAKVYFNVFDNLITKQKDYFKFDQRTRRPPLDPVNALLSFTYTLLQHDVNAALETVGLDPQMGYLHKDRPGRNSLSLDLMEEFRPYFADRMVINLINLGQISESDFIEKENGAYILTDDARKLVLTSWQKRKLEDITHPFINEKIQVGLLPYVQAMLLARHMRGDLDDYPPFLWK